MCVCVCVFVVVVVVVKGLIYLISIRFFFIYLNHFFFLAYFFPFQPIAHYKSTKVVQHNTQELAIPIIQ